MLVARGLGVVVLERDGIAAGALGVQPGGVRQQWRCMRLYELRQAAA